MGICRHTLAGSDVLDNEIVLTSAKQLIEAGFTGDRDNTF